MRLPVPAALIAAKAQSGRAFAGPRLGAFTRLSHRLKNELCVLCYPSYKQHRGFSMSST